MVSFVIPVRDDAQHLRRCLDRIARSDYPADRIDVVVVDNGSTDDSAAVARKSGATVLEIAGARVGELRNRGVEVAQGEILAFVDADHEIDPAWIRRAVDTLRTPGVGAVGALCRAPVGGTWVQRLYDTLRTRPLGLHEVEWLGSGNMAVRSELFQQVGGFDRMLDTCEDVDLCQRLRTAGYRLMSDDRLQSVHLGDPATLRALFLGELWRGRDNLRVSLRGPFSLRGLPSLVIPVIDIGSILIGVAGLAAAPLGGVRLTLIASAIIAGLAALRAAGMIARGGITAPLEAGRAFAVACVYDVARALALVTRTRHRRVRQRTPHRETA